MNDNCLPVEYLTYIASVGDDESVFKVRYQDENIWLTQKMMSLLYDVSVSAMSQYIKRIYEDGELVPEATIKKYLTVQIEKQLRKRVYTWKFGMHMTKMKI